jgi:hypothetical protein
MVTEQGNALTRDEHLDWCRKRAVASMASDLKTHPDTDNPALNGLVTIGMMYVTDGDKLAVQRWIERLDDREPVGLRGPGESFSDVILRLAGRQQ